MKGAVEVRALRRPWPRGQRLRGWLGALVLPVLALGCAGAEPDAGGDDLAVEATTRPKVFTPDVEEATRSARGFVAQLNRENLAEARSYWDDLARCREALARAGREAEFRTKDDKGEHVQPKVWADTVFTTEDGAPFRLTSLIQSYGDLAAAVPLRLTNYIVKDIETMHALNGDLCSEVSGTKMGASTHRRLYEGLVAEVGSARGRLLLRAFVDVAGMLDRFGGDGAVDKVVGLFPKEVLGLFPFLEQPWARRFLVAVLGDPRTRKHIRELVGLSGAPTLQEVMDATYQVSSPVQLHYEGTADNNELYPFVDYNSRGHFRKAEVLSCMGTLYDATRGGTVVREDDWRGKDAIDLFGKLFRRVKAACPGLSAPEAVSVLTVTDRALQFVLPLSMKKTLRREMSLTASDLQAPKVLGRETAAEEEVYRRYRGAEGFSYLVKRMLLPTSYHHATTPVFLKCELSPRLGDGARLRAAVYLGGLVYQLFDAEAKVRYGLAGIDAIIANALADLGTWEQALALEVCP